MKSNDRSNYIYIYNNYDFNLQKPGTKIHIKCLIPSVKNNQYDFSNNNTYYNPANIEKYKNRVILSARIDAEKNNKQYIYPVILLTQQNLSHNIKCIHLNNDFLKPRILFLKYNTTNNIINNNLFLIDNSESDMIVNPYWNNLEHIIDNSYIELNSMLLFCNLKH